MAKVVKRKNPYEYLLEEAKGYVQGVRTIHRSLMWYYESKRLNEGWPLYNVNERVLAADQLGYDVQLKSTERGLEVWYVKRPPEPPWRLT